MLPRIFSEINNGIWAIHKPFADSYLPLLHSILEGKFQQNDLTFKESEEKIQIRYIHEQGSIYHLSEYGYYDSPEQAPKNSIAVMNMIDVISKYDIGCGGPAGTTTKADLVDRLYDNPNVKGLILNIDSGGGEGYAAKEFSRKIKEDFDKPVKAFVDDMAASAAYYIASATDKIIANSEMAYVGSIGTYVTLADYKGWYEKQGIKIKEIYADKSTDKNKAYYEAIEGNEKTLKEAINIFNQDFLDTVARNRDGLPEEKEWGTGKMFYAEKAWDIGLIDGIATWDEMVAEFIEELNI